MVFSFITNDLLTYLYSDSSTKAVDQWTYKSMTATKSLATVGRVGNYWGGGFVADLGYNASTAIPVNRICSDTEKSIAKFIFVVAERFTPK